MTGDLPSSGRPLRWYRSLPIGSRAHVAGRWLTGPFGAIEALLPESGRILDWGCGHGVLALFAADRQPGRTVVGTDIDAAKLGGARRAVDAAGHADRVELRQVAPDAVPEGEWDAIVLNDVVYLLAADRQQRLVRACAAALAPGGVLVSKELGPSPRWKHRLSRIQEHLSVSALRITATGDGLQPFPDPAVVAGWMADAGLTTEVVPMDRGYHVPHVAAIGRRPG